MSGLDMLAWWGRGVKRWGGGSVGTAEGWKRGGVKSPGGVE